MYDSITKDIIYRISLSGNNPLAGYLVVKTYGDKQKRRRMCCLDDIRQQVQEWDDDYCRNHSDFENRGINVLLGKNKEKTRPDGAKLKNLKMYTIHTTKSCFGKAKPACKNCTYTLKGKIKENYTGWEKEE